MRRSPRLRRTTAKGIVITDLAVNPASRKAYLTVSRGKSGSDAAPVLVRVDRAGKPEIVSLEGSLSPRRAYRIRPPRNGRRTRSITDLAYVDGRVFIAGLSNEEFASRLLSVPFPFADASKGTSVEIYHGAHGKFETGSPVRTFASYQVQGEPYLLAAYTCTRWSSFPWLSSSRVHVKGTTIAELGNHNKPLDLLVYQKDGKDFLLLTNSSRGVMKIPTDKVETQEGITKKVAETDGIAYEKIENLKGSPNSMGSIRTMR